MENKKRNPAPNDLVERIQEIVAHAGLDFSFCYGKNTMSKKYDEYFEKYRKCYHEVRNLLWNSLRNEY